MDSKITCQILGILSVNVNVPVNVNDKEFRSGTSTFTFTFTERANNLACLISILKFIHIIRNGDIAMLIQKRTTRVSTSASSV